MAEGMATGSEFSFAVRQNVADALSEMVNMGTLAPEVFDEVGARLLPEAYPELAEWTAAGMPKETALTCTTALKELAANDRLTHQQSSQARMFLGIIGVEIAA